MSSSIADLPTDPVGGGNITLTATEQPRLPPQQAQPPPMSLDESTIHQIVSGLQQASATGATQLPSRHIPMDSSQMMMDANVQPNYVPMPPPTHASRGDYIRDYMSKEEMIDSYNQRRSNANSLEDMYSEMQVPLILAVLYFLFQLPVFRRFFFQYFPVLFTSDGNYNLNGYLFSSILFALVFYLLQKVTGYIGVGM